MKITTTLALCAFAALPLLAAGLQAAPAITLNDLNHLEGLAAAETWPLLAADLATPPAATPAPTVVVVQAPADPMARSNGWIATGTAVIITAFVLSGFAAKKVVEVAPMIAEAITAIKDLRSRADRQAAKTGSLQEQVTNVAIAAGTTPPPASPPPSITTPAIVALLMAASMGLMGCSTTTADPVKNARNAATKAATEAALVDAVKVLGAGTVRGLLNYAGAEMGGKKANLGSSLAQGLWVGVDYQTAASVFGDIAGAYSAHKLPQTTAAVQQAATAAISRGQDPVTVANALATVVSTAAGAPPAK